MDPVLERIDAWQQAGLIDPPIAARLRAAEAAAPASPRTHDTARDRPRRGVAVADVFGPGPTVAELFVYLGVGFLLGAWTAFVARLAGQSSGQGLTIGFGFGLAAAVLVLIGFVLRAGDDRRQRAAGAALLLALGYLAASGTAFLSPALSDGVTAYAIVAASTLFFAVAFRLFHPGLLTQLGLLAAATAFASAVLALLQRQLLPISRYGLGSASGIDLFPVVVASAVIWLLTGLALGVVAVAEDRAAVQADPVDAARAARRATLTRAWAGLVAVGGLTSALTQSQYLNQQYTRVVPPWIAELAILALAIVLVERAFRRDSGAFLLAAGIGFITALTDFNFTYLTSSTDVGLLVEGVILLAVGFAADRLRRRLAGRGRGGDGPDREAVAPVSVALEPAAPEPAAPDPAAESAPLTG